MYSLRGMTISKLWSYSDKKQNKIMDCHYKYGAWWRDSPVWVLSSPGSTCWGKTQQRKVYRSVTAKSLLPPLHSFVLHVISFFISSKCIIYISFLWLNTKMLTITSFCHCVSVWFLTAFLCHNKHNTRGKNTHKNYNVREKPSEQHKWIIESEARKIILNLILIIDYLTW